MAPVKTANAIQTDDRSARGRSWRAFDIGMLGASNSNSRDGAAMSMTPRLMEKS
jgi:hypothetical protein